MAEQNASWMATLLPMITTCFTFDHGVRYVQFALLTCGMLAVCYGSQHLLVAWYKRHASQTVPVAARADQQQARKHLSNAVELTNGFPTGPAVELKHQLYRGLKAISLQMDSEDRFWNTSIIPLIARFPSVVLPYSGSGNATQWINDALEIFLMYHTMRKDLLLRILMIQSLATDARDAATQELQKHDATPESAFGGYWKVYKELKIAREARLTSIQEHLSLAFHYESANICRQTKIVKDMIMMASNSESEALSSRIIVCVKLPKILIQWALGSDSPMTDFIEWIEYNTGYKLLIDPAPAGANVPLWYVQEFFNNIEIIMTGQSIQAAHRRYLDYKCMVEGTSVDNPLGYVQRFFNNIEIILTGQSIQAAHRRYLDYKCVVEGTSVDNPLGYVQRFFNDIEIIMTGQSIPAAHRRYLKTRG